MSTNRTPEQANLLLETAKQAAAAGDPITMLEALSESGFLDGLVRRLRKEFGRLPPFELDECVARTVDVTYAFIAQGGPVRDLGAWLWKSARNNALAKWHSDYELRGSADIAAPELQTEGERAAADALDEHRSAEAIRLARELIPRIGEGQIIDVIEMVIDAAEKGVPDLSPSEIADALGLSEDAVRTLTSRGLKRLRREAERAGVTFPDDIHDAQTDIETEN